MLVMLVVSHMQPRHKMEEFYWWELESSVTLYLHWMLANAKIVLKMYWI